jgi:hypothetical protein
MPDSRIRKYAPNVSGKSFRLASAMECIQSGRYASPSSTGDKFLHPFERL